MCIRDRTITLERAIELIQEKRSNEEKRHIKTFEEDDKLELLNGRYGPFRSSSLSSSSKVLI